MRIIDEAKLNFDDVLIQPQRSTTASRSAVDLTRSFRFCEDEQLKCVPVIAANMDSTGTFAMAKALSSVGMLTCLHKHYSEEKLIEFFRTSEQEVIERTFYSLGIKLEERHKLERVQNASGYSIKNVCIDVANGYTDHFVEQVGRIRERNDRAFLMAGNVVTPDMTAELIQHGGVDVVKVGIGPGSVCTTRFKTGVGYPQLSAIIECADAAHGLGKHICADGGCSTPGDVAKAFGGGADFVMLGGMFAGADECDGDWEWEYEKEWNDEPKTLSIPVMGGEIVYPNPKFTACIVKPNKVKTSLRFYGMSSKEAMAKYHGGVAEYRTDEGRAISVPFKGTAIDVAKDIMGGLRSTCAYVGANQIKHLPKRTTFVRT